jgi:DNA-binding CsgD family transcriptional regulator/PAS domain-containing protein
LSVSANPEVLFGGQSAMLGLIETIYSAVEAPELWTTVLDQVATAIHGQCTTLWVRTPTEDLVAKARMDPAAWDAYATYYSSINVLMERCDRRFKEGSVRYSHVAMPEQELVGTEFYNDFFARHHMHYSMGIKIGLKDLPAAYLSCQRSQQEDRFTSLEGAVYEALLPHLQRALSLSIKLQQAHAKSEGALAALEAFDHAIFALDATGRVVWMSHQAEALLTTRHGLYAVGDQLFTVSASANLQLKTLLDGAVACGSGTGVASGGGMLVPRPGDRPALRLTVTPFRSSLPSTSRRLAALVFVSDPAGRPKSRTALLQGIYALTPSESRVAEMLLHGLEVRDVGTALGMSLETARFHTKRVLAKTGTRRQSELIRLMLSLPHS